MKRRVIEVRHLETVEKDIQPDIDHITNLFSQFTVLSKRQTRKYIKVKSTNYIDIEPVILILISSHIVMGFLTEIGAGLARNFSSMIQSMYYKYRGKEIIFASPQEIINSVGTKNGQNDCKRGPTLAISAEVDEEPIGKHTVSFLFLPGISRQELQDAVRSFPIKMKEAIRRQKKIIKRSNPDKSKAIYLYDKKNGKWVKARKL